MISTHFAAHFFWWDFFSIHPTSFLAMFLYGIFRVQYLYYLCLYQYLPWDRSNRGIERRSPQDLSPQL